MAKHLIIAGHGKRKNGTFDPGATGLITKGEHRYMTENLFPAMKKYASKDFTFHTSYNVLSYGNIVSLAKGYDTVTEFHFDATGSAQASGGHVIVYSQFKPDAMDLRLRDAIKSMVGVRYNHMGELGISGRSNLGNVNRSASGRVNYRLVELGFGTNKKDSDVMLNKVDEYAQKLVEAISGKSVAVKTGWMKDSKSWWWQNADGSYPRNEWKKVDGIWYHFDKHGYIAIGWKKIDNKWYYFHTNGRMLTGWRKINNKWYCLNMSGVMQTGWRKSAGKWYYLNSSGAMQTGLITVSGKHYYLERSGALITDESIELEANKHGHLA